MEWYHYLIIVLAAAVGIIIGCAIGFAYRKKVAEREIGSAEAEATRLINEAIRNGENRKKEMLLEAKDEIHKSRTDLEKEVKDRRAELTKQERRLEQKEATLDKKTEAFERKEEELSRRLADAAKTQEAAEEAHKQQLTTLEKISGLTQEEAKQFLLRSVEEDVRHDAAMKIKEIEQQLKDEAEEKAREIIATAIQRCAADHAAETTVSVVPLPNDEMKGRIIGREGRNIRTLETVTGVDLIIDDTPEAITVSSFDPVRREIARLALEKLIADGRIHPTRIEDMVEKARKEVDRTIREEGERACYETGVHNLNPELIKILGRQKYRTSYGQNVLNHSIEVAHIAGLMAAELGVDVALAKRAGLLHDLGKSIDHEVEGSHVQLGADLARKFKENPVVINAIEAHHGDVEPKTVIAVLVQAADAVSAARPGARRENVENYIRRLEKLEELTGSYPGVDKAYAIQAGREVRIMVKPEVVTEDNMILLARDIAKKIESELEYPGQIKVNVIRETKAVEFAK
ncbi:MAG: ribonuclease Y [Oscillospiraceae bacterium]|nr:ribonuclease Y [Clostridiales bacterium]MDD7674195.1 ribonuclease Y [Oscillospiraceae bacterium]MDY5641916.1 ribonuclease Y [Candidatus Faecousia sp.]